MTETLDAVPAAAHERGSRSGGLATMNVAELKGMAGSLGISGLTKMRKGDLIAAIAAKQSSGGQSRAQSGNGDRAPRREAGERRSGGDAQADRAPAVADSTGASEGAVAREPREARETGDRSGSRTRGQNQGGQSQGGQSQGGQSQGGQSQGGQSQGGQSQGGQNQGGQQAGQRDNTRQQGGQQDNARQQSQRQSAGNPSSSGEQRYDNRQQGQQGQQGSRYDDDDRSGRRRSRQRSRDRKRGRGREGGFVDTVEPEVQIAEDDVLVPVAGILDVLDNYGFVRTSGYLPGPGDVYVPLGMVKRHGLRKGDAVTGAVRAGREGEGMAGQGPNRAKFNALVRLDTVNGMTPDQARDRVEFGKLVPLYPQERLRLETTPNVLTTRIIDLVAPLGKGQRGLIVSPPKAGKTLVLQAIANAITTNNPEAHLMVVLVDERPEEVTDMQRTVKGEVIASTFDRPADDHTTVAELAIERAKRLVELGHDVVVLLDSITRLGRAYNIAAPASGRILSGGVDSSALYPPKRFFGAARNIENGGSLTILATALVETGSKMDEVIFEEFKGTGNMELRLSRHLADRRIFPAVDVNPSGTRREEILMGTEELKIMWKLRRVLSALDSQQAIELLIDRLKKSKTNVEFLRQVQMTSSIKLDDEDDD